MESQNRKKALELGHTHQPFCSEDDEPKNEGRCSGKPRIFTFCTVAQLYDRTTEIIFQKNTFVKKLYILAPARTLFISGLKSRVLKLPFFT